MKSPDILTITDDLFLLEQHLLDCLQDNRVSSEPIPTEALLALKAAVDRVRPLLWVHLSRRANDEKASGCETFLRSVFENVPRGSDCEAV